MLDKLDSTPEVLLSSIVVGELFHGAINSRRKEEHIARLEAFVADCGTVICDNDTARQYGLIKTEFKRVGSRIPENDIWIAACAVQHDIPLATRDGHFKNIPMLISAHW